ncbi:hypothetical protein BVRB_1g017760 [Beta vulgaris subsp. vulgaris]|nr:hypothetical protein BVRB_1g017760 [Beta vulgaris subsp. vulgaris]
MNSCMELGLRGERLDSNALLFLRHAEGVDSVELNNLVFVWGALPAKVSMNPAQFNIIRIQVEIGYDLSRML